MPRTLNVGATSLFVTLTAWLAIALAALVSVVAGLQHAEVASMLPQWQRVPLPRLSGWLLHYLPWVMAATAVLSLLLVAAAVGLLLRLDWARRAFIGLAALAIAAHLCGLWLQHEVVQALVQHTLGRARMPAEAAGMFGGLATATQAMGVLLTLAGCALMAWVIRRLMSEPVRQEFA
jgi:hypothetical protein